MSNTNQKGEESADIETIDDTEFWQRIALEAIVNDDPAKALSLRVTAYFSGVKCYPRQSDTLRVIGVSHRELFEWTHNNSTFDFEFETIEEDHRGLLVRGIEYTRFGDEFSTNSDPENADEKTVIDHGQENIDPRQIEVVEDEAGKRWQVSWCQVREPTPLGPRYRSRVILYKEKDSEKLHPQTFADRVIDGTYSIRDR